MKQLASRVLQIEPPPIKEVAVLAESTPDLINLGQGLPSFATPDHIRAAVKQALDQDVSIGKYSLYSGTKKLKKAVADRLKAESDFTLDPEKEVVITVGAIEAIAGVVFSLIEPGDEVIVPVPNYPPYFNTIRLAGGVVKAVTTQPTYNWQLDLQAIAETITPKTKLIIISNPANPTGAVYSKASLLELARLAKTHDLAILADETYSFLTYDQRSHFSLASLAEIKERLFLVRTFSKEYAMTGWRIGFLAAPAAITPQILKVHESFIGCPPTVSQVAALAALTGPQDGVAEFQKAFANRRQLVCRRLDRFNQIFSYQKPQGTYYVWVKFAPETAASSWELSKRLIKEAGVAVIPGSVFGWDSQTFNNYLRISFGADESVINEGFDRLEKFFSKTTAEIIQ